MSGWIEKMCDLPLVPFPRDVFLTVRLVYRLHEVGNVGA